MHIYAHTLLPVFTQTPPALPEICGQHLSSKIDGLLGVKHKHIFEIIVFRSLIQLMMKYTLLLINVHLSIDSR